eukprot:430421-Amphidinium_carterae.1
MLKLQWPPEDCVEAWRAVIVGPANTPYAGGMYEMDICFPENYPYEQPALRFNTPIYHVNVPWGVRVMWRYNL